MVLTTEKVNPIENTGGSNNTVIYSKKEEDTEIQKLTKIVEDICIAVQGKNVNTSRKQYECYNCGGKCHISRYCPENMEIVYKKSDGDRGGEMVALFNTLKVRISEVICTTQFPSRKRLRIYELLNIPENSPYHNEVPGNNNYPKQEENRSDKMISPKKKGN
ncbi:hypothetical protein AYI70_g6061 [Smittium culicis]|uniref:CCHC-type domain-containing protein n=1 Tax=Smittium culicis TaxID=133412 RepID=A0A1R1XRQ2_9FUNG|nr:hypothetical protein AYI70_g6061 [Smittium culicis]